MAPAGMDEMSFATDVVAGTYSNIAISVQGLGGVTEQTFWKHARAVTVTADYADGRPPARGFNLGGDLAHRGPKLASWLGSHGFELAQLTTTAFPPAENVAAKKLAHATDWMRIDSVSQDKCVSCGRHPIGQGPYVSSTSPSGHDFACAACYAAAQVRSAEPTFEVLLRFMRADLRHEGDGGGVGADKLAHASDWEEGGDLYFHPSLKLMCISSPHPANTCKACHACLNHHTGEDGHEGTDCSKHQDDWDKGELCLCAGCGAPAGEGYYFSRTAPRGRDVACAACNALRKKKPAAATAAPTELLRRASFNAVPF